MDLRQLEILRAVADTGSFTGAGQRLHLSQSAVSRQILLLEEELKEQLFLRLGRKVRITPTGTTLLGLSQRLFDDLEQTRASIVESQQRVTGSLRLVGGMTVCLYVFPPLLKAFRKDYPNVDVKLTRKRRHGSFGSCARRCRSRPADAYRRSGLVSVRVVSAPRRSPRTAGRRSITPGSRPPAFVPAGSGSRRDIEEFFVRGRSRRKWSPRQKTRDIKASALAYYHPYQAVAVRSVRGRCFARLRARSSCARWAGSTSASTGSRWVQEMMRTLERIRPHLKLSPGGREPAKPPAAAAKAPRPSPEPTGSPFSRTPASVLVM